MDLGQEMFLVRRPREPRAKTGRLAVQTQSTMKQPQEFEKNHFQDEDGMFNVEVPAIRGCVAWGKTPRECYRNAVDAIESCLEARETIATTKLRKSRYIGLNIYRRPVHA